MLIAQKLLYPSLACPGWTQLNIGSASEAKNLTLGTSTAYFDSSYDPGDWSWSTVSSSDDDEKGALYHTTTQLPYMGGSNPDSTG